MIQLIFSSMEWGITPIEQRDPETGAMLVGREIVMLDRKSEMVVRFQFVGDDDLKKVIGDVIATVVKPDIRHVLAEVVADLPDMEKRVLEPLFGGSIEP